MTLQRIKEFTDPRQRIGATYIESEGVNIRLWAPNIKEAHIEWVGNDKTVLHKENGYFSGFFPTRQNGDRYYFHCDGHRIPDPASRLQPEGVFGPSEVVEDTFEWKAGDWNGTALAETIIYEIHPGTFSDKHNFEGIIDDLPRLKDLGITTLEIMPVSQFSGARNWGYDGVFPHAVQNTYGGPREFKRLIDAAHSHGLSVILDVVYNHLGPEGNVLFSLGPYVQSKYKTPWGEALNYDGAYSHEVRKYFLQTIYQWIMEYRLDGLRFDAIQTILDTSPLTFLQEANILKEYIEAETGREIVFMAETDMNDPRTLDPIEKNGMNFDAQWADDYHHALHVTLTGEKDGYYSDYGGAKQIAEILKNGVAYQGDYSNFHKRPHGKSYAHIDKTRLIVQSQNHDQIGNRLLGERLITLAGFEKSKLSAACVLLSPFTPLLFMGEEIASENPFQYFVSHISEELNNAVIKGRLREWECFDWKSEPPNPVSEEIFNSCILKNKKHHNPNSECMSAYYKELITFSKKFRKLELTVNLYNDNLIQLNYGNDIIVMLSFCEQEHIYPPLAGDWVCTLDSSKFIPDHKNVSEKENTISPYSAIILERQ